MMRHITLRARQHCLGEIGGCVQMNVVADRSASRPNNSGSFPHQGRQYQLLQQLFLVIVTMGECVDKMALASK